MIFKQNIAQLGVKIKPYEKMVEQHRKENACENYSLINTRVDIPTLQIERDGKKVFLHSKYNPLQEVEAVMNENEENIAASNHVIFFGIGLGYHVEKIMTKYRDKTFTMIEPDPYIFARFLESRELTTFPFEQMSFLYVKNDEFSLQSFLANIVGHVGKESSMVVLPAYDRLYQKETDVFYQAYKNALLMTRSTVAAKRAFGKRWIINSLMNVLTTLKTLNIGEVKHLLKGKPIIIAAAGPSLYDDLEQLKYIKKHGLAYIFAVGSANKVLLKNEVVPDAVLTYDPQPHNVNVYKELIASGRTDIPMIYGTSVGFETLEAYAGPKVHLVTSADPVSHYYLNKERNVCDVSDATTIALIALQVAQLVETSLVILAGQNLAFKENRFYSKGVQYGEWSGEVRSEKEGREIITTTDVYGNAIETNESLTNMRRDIEVYLESMSHIKVINTTKGGADIKGAPFMPIEEVINHHLVERAVDPKWNEIKENQIPRSVLTKIKKMERSIEKFAETFQKCHQHLIELDRLKKTSQREKIHRLFDQYDKALDRLLANEFYQIFVQSIVSNDLEQLNKTIKNNYEEQDQIKKINVITSANMTFLRIVNEISNEMIVHIKESLHVKLNEMLDESTKLYKHNDGVFYYEGEWERESLTFDDFSKGKTQRKLTKMIATVNSNKGAKINFRFHGTELKVIAATHTNHASHMKIMIDGKVKTFTTKQLNVKEEMLPQLQQTVFEVKSLSNDMHDVTIEVTTNEKFAFQGIKINREGRIYHIHEVTSIEELKVGKRIRCHYKATTNKVGIFNRLGEETNNFIPVESTPQPDGDFYFIMVDEMDGEKKLIADRNVQNYISFDQIIEGLKINSSIKGYRETMIRLLNSPENNHELDEWYMYLQLSTLNGEFTPDNETIWNHERNVDKGIGRYSIIEMNIGESGVYSKYHHIEKNIIHINSRVKIPSNEVHLLWGFRPLVLID